MYNLSDIKTKDATLFEAQDFEDLVIEGDINQSATSKTEIINDDQKN